ncbi:MAG TPA: S66 peptidase family protein [Candidatus Nanoarchaeia archaeon]|nr:S66 peptidase family protein [Candidatus Nanoarchaeia archaeon]
MIKPKKLKKRDTIAIISPSSGLAKLFPHRIERAKNALEQLGFNVKLFPTTSKFNNGKAGTVAERVTDIHNAFSDKSIKAIICAIGGLSSNELLEKMDYDLIKKNPKIFCGYSDITLLHCAFQKKSNLVTFYGPCAMTQLGEYPEPLKYTVDFFLKAVASDKPVSIISSSEKWTDEVLDWGTKEDLKRPRKLLSNQRHVWLKEGKAEGKIVGGCLYSLLQVKGTEYDIDYNDKILFIEVPEGEDFTKGTPLSYVDSQLMDLRNAGVFDKIKGLIVGMSFGYGENEQNEFKELVRNHTHRYTFPVLFNANMGHADPIITIPLGVKANLDSRSNLFSIDESGTES